MMPEDALDIRSMSADELRVQIEHLTGDIEMEVIEDPDVHGAAPMRRVSKEVPGWPSALLTHLQRNPNLCWLSEHIRNSRGIWGRGAHI